MSALTAELVDAIVTAVHAVDGVVGLDDGPVGEVATYLPGRRVHGVRAGDDRVEVHIIVAYGSDVPGVADQVRTRVQALSGGPVDVFVEDIAAPDETERSAHAAGPGGYARD